MKLSAVILTFNEALNLEDCLQSIRRVAEEIFVVDSGSTDDTLKIAQRCGAKLVFHPFETHAKQWNWALSHLPVEGDWVLGLDADQRLTEELGEEILTTLDNPPSGVEGFYLNRRQIFRGQWIRHGGYYPKYLLKLFRRRSASCDESEIMEHHFYVKGKTAKLTHDMIEANRKEDDLAFWLSKHMNYARSQAEEEFRRVQHPEDAKIRPRFFGSPDQRTLWLKQVWRRLPLFARPFLYFFYRYFLRLGFLDGKQGFIFHFFQGFWYRLLVDVCLNEIKSAGSLPR